MKHQQMVQEVADPFHVPGAVVTEIPEQGAKVQHLASQCRWLIEGYATCLDQLAKHKHKLVLQHQRRDSAKADVQREPTFMVGGGLLRTWEESVDLVHFGGNDAERNINEIFPSLMDTYLVLRCDDAMNVCKFAPTRDYDGCHRHHTRERFLQTIIDLYPVVVIKRGTAFPVVVCNSEMVDLALAAFDENEASSSPRGGARAGAGRPRVEEKYPDLVPFRAQFVGTCGAQEAERRRQDDKWRSTGVTLDEMKDRAANMGMDVSRTAIHHLFEGPRSTTARYKCLIAARPIRRCNSQRAPHIRGHWAVAKVRYRSEFAATEPSVLLFSADDMSKKGILRNSVSHKTVPTGFTLLEDAPICLDHDFPVSDRMLLCTSGYFLMNEGKGEQVNDSNGRPQFAKPKGTALHLCNRAFRYQGPNADRHVQHFLEF